MHAVHVAWFFCTLIYVFDVFNFIWLVLLIFKFHSTLWYRTTQANGFIPTANLSQLVLSTGWVCDLSPSISVTREKLTLNQVLTPSYFVMAWSSKTLFGSFILVCTVYEEIFLPHSILFLNIKRVCHKMWRVEILRLWVKICAVLPVLELDRLSIAHPHINSDVVEWQTHQRDIWLNALCNRPWVPFTDKS